MKIIEHYFFVALHFHNAELDVCHYKQLLQFSATWAEKSGSRGAWIINGKYKTKLENKDCINILQPLDHNNIKYHAFIAVK